MTLALQDPNPARVGCTARSLLALIALAVAPALVAQDGLPDAGFAGGLPKLWGFTGAPDAFATTGGIVVDVEGRTIIVGGRGVDSSGRSRELVVSRLDRGGELDASFGVGGVRAYSSWLQSLHVVTDAKLDHQGRIVFAGQVGGQAMVARLLPDGSFDPTFAGTGVVLSAVGGEVGSGTVAEQVAIDADDSVLAVGRRQQSNASGFYALPVVWKLTSLGQTDNTFAMNGVWAPPVNDQNQGSFSGVVATAGDRWLAVGAIGLPGPGGAQTDAYAVKLTTNGQLDAGFGQQGVARYSFGGTFAAFNDVSIARDTSYRIAGSVSLAGGPVVVVAAIDPQGAVLSGYGASGLATVRTSNDPIEIGYREDILSQPDDGVLVGGPIVQPGGFGQRVRAVSVQRITPAGVQDESYGNSGVARLTFGAGFDGYSQYWGGLATGPGRAVVAGALYEATRTQFAAIGLRDRFLFSNGFE